MDERRERGGRGGWLSEVEESKRQDGDRECQVGGKGQAGQGPGARVGTVVVDGRLPGGRPGGPAPRHASQPGQPGVRRRWWVMGPLYGACLWLCLLSSRTLPAWWATWHARTSACILDTLHCMHLG